MAKNSFLISRLFQNRAVFAARGRLRNTKIMPVEDTNKQDCPKLTSLVLILLLIMLAGVFLVQAMA